MIGPKAGETWFVTIEETEGALDTAMILEITNHSVLLKGSIGRYGSYTQRFNILDVKFISRVQ